MPRHTWGRVFTSPYFQLLRLLRLLSSALRNVLNIYLCVYMSARTSYTTSSTCLRQPLLLLLLFFKFFPLPHTRLTTHNITRISLPPMECGWIHSFVQAFQVKDNQQWLTMKNRQEQTRTEQTRTDKNRQEQTRTDKKNEEQTRWYWIERGSAL